MTEEREDVLTDSTTERAMLSFLLTVGLQGQTGMFADAITRVNEHDFTTEARRKIFKALTLCSQDGVVDVVNIENWMRNEGYGDNGPIKFELSEITGLLTSIAGNYEAYSKQLSFLTARRKVREVGHTLTRTAELLDSDITDASGIVAKARSLVTDCEQDTNLHDSPVMLQDVALDVISTAYGKEETSIIGLPTGVADGAFDELTCGIEPGSYWIVAGLAGIGKSTLINAIVRGVRQNSPCAGIPLICSTEMMPRAVAMFALAGATGIHTKALARGGLSPSQKEKLLQVGRENTLEGIAVLYCGGMTVDKTLMLARRQHEAAPCPLVVIDVAGQLKGDGEKEYDRVSDISIKIKHFAKSQNICTIACVHLNREVKNEKDYEPKLWNLRGSGEWEQNADRVLFIHRKSMFFGSQNQEASPVTHIIQAKDRMYGDHRAIDIVWSKELGRYTTAQPDELTAG